jgi:hypothetical protein
MFPARKVISIIESSHKKDKTLNNDDRFEVLTALASFTESHLRE